jgi:nitrogen fixation protein FixH
MRNWRNGLREEREVVHAAPISRGRRPVSERGPLVVVVAVVEARAHAAVTQVAEGVWRLGFGCGKRARG